MDKPGRRGGPAVLYGATQNACLLARVGLAIRAHQHFCAFAGEEYLLASTARHVPRLGHSATEDNCIWSAVLDGPTAIGGHVSRCSRGVLKLSSRGPFQLAFGNPLPQGSLFYRQNTYIGDVSPEKDGISLMLQQIDLESVKMS